MAKKDRGKAAAFWNTFLESPPDLGSIAQRDALKQFRMLPDDLEPSLYARVARYFSNECAYAFWPVVAQTPPSLIPTLVEVLGDSTDYEARALLRAHQVGGADALLELAALIAWFDKSTNLPGLLKRMPSHPPLGPTLTGIIVTIVKETKERTNKLWPFWGLAWLAMRADAALVEELEARSAGWIDTILGGTDEDVFRRVRASALGAPKKAAPKKKPVATLDLPAKVSEAKKWLAAHAPLTPETLKTLACRPKQKAQEAAAAIRTLALVGGDAALEVLASYRPDVTGDGADHAGAFGDTFQLPVATELIRAWPRFGRDFAQRMFSDLSRLWLLQSGTAVDDLTGIDAAAGLSDLRILLGSTCDLTPLTACADLARVHLNLALRSDNASLEPLAGIPKLTHLELYNTHRLADSWVETLGQVTKVERLYIAVEPCVNLGFLLSLPALRRLKLAAGEGRKVDDAMIALFRELARRGTEISFYRHENWPLKLAKRVSDLAFVDDAGIVLTADASRKDALLMAARMNSFLEADAGPDLARHLRTQTVVSVPAIAGG